MLRLVMAALIAVAVFPNLAVAGTFERARFDILSGSHPTMSRPAAGKGSCGAVCEDPEKGTFSCGKGERPLWDDAGRCTCVADGQCAE
jgi:hypothetical protein